MPAYDVIYRVRETVGLQGASWESGAGGVGVESAQDLGKGCSYLFGQVSLHGK